MVSARASTKLFKGKESNGVVQYLGIQYARLKDRLAVPELIEEYDDEIVDATKYGPRAIALEACGFEQTVLIQQELVTPAAPAMSGVDCLNLNITTPTSAGEKLLPVLVFIHGGGYIIGSSWWPQYDPARLVRLSAQNGTPIIAVNFNYRLAVMGNLTSEELRQAGYPGNNSLRDQRCALEWIKTHIAGFGGDPENITVSGESAGAASVLTHLFSKEALFKRAISMSGTPITLKPLPAPVSEMAYGMMMDNLGLENATTEEKIHRLLTIDENELVEKTPMSVPLMPIADGDLVPGTTTFDKVAKLEDLMPGAKWCSELMIGDCQHDGNVFAFMGLLERTSGIASALITSLTKNLCSPTAAEAIGEAYGITSTTPDHSAMKIIIDLATDIAYYAPAVAFAQSFPGKAFYYQFNEPNPWEGAFKGHSTHMLDAAYLFQNYQHKLDDRAREVGLAMARDVASFMYGKAPWKAYSKETGTARVFGRATNDGNGEDCVEQNGWGNGRRETLFQLSREGKVDLDELSAAWDMFVAGQ